MNAHLKRWLTALVLLPGIVGIIIWGPSWLFALLIMAVSVGGTWEYHHLVLDGKDVSLRTVGMVGAAALPLVFLFAGPATVLGVVILLLITMFFLELDRARGAAVIDLNPLFRVAFGLWYVPLAISHFIWFHHSFAGVLWVFFILVLAFSGDTAAYYVGRTWGRKKLMPRISAGKTVEGTVALVVFSTFCCGLYGWWFFPQYPLYHSSSWA